MRAGSVVARYPVDSEWSSFPLVPSATTVQLLAAAGGQRGDVSGTGRKLDASCSSRRTAWMADVSVSPNDSAA